MYIILPSRLNEYPKGNMNETIFYFTPNPFIDQIHFEFSSVIAGPIKFSLYDVMGRLVASEEKRATDTILTISDLSLAEGQYFVKLSAKNYNYSTNLLKTQ